jgi:hypothetical protein
MSANGPHSVEDAALTQQVEAAWRECDALTAALARSRRSRLVFLLLVIAFVAVVCFVFVGLGREVMGEKFQNQLLDQAQERFDKNSETYMKEVRALVDNAGPKVRDAFMEQVKKDMPKYVQNMELQRDKFAETLKTNVESKLKAHYTGLVERQQKILQEEFKDIEDPKKHERMMANIDRAVQKLVKRYYVDELETQLNQLYSLWDEFPPAPAPKPGDLTAEEQLIKELLDMLTYKLAHRQGLAMR